MRKKSKVKLIFLMTSLFYGGAETQMRKIIRALNTNNQIDTTVLIEKRISVNNDEEQEYIKLNSNIKFINMNITTNNQYVRLLTSWGFILHYLKKNKSDVFFTYTLNGLMCLPICHACGVKLIYSERNSGETITAKKLYVSVLKRVDALTCNSESADNYLKKATGKDVKQINNGIDLPERMLTLSTDRFTKLLIPARIHRDKNQKYLIQCLDRSMNVELFFAGKVDDENYYQELIALCKEKGIESQCHWLGYVKNIPLEYPKYDLVILPSIAEGTPNVVLEAFAYGMPVIASNIKMTAPLYEDKQLIFNLDDMQGVNKCLRYLDSMSGEDRVKMAKRNRCFVENNYSTEVMTNNYINTILGVV